METNTSVSAETQPKQLRANLRPPESSTHLPACPAFEGSPDLDLEGISARLDDLFDQTRLAVEVRDSALLASILRELTLLNDFQADLVETRGCE